MHNMISIKKKLLLALMALLLETVGTVFAQGTAFQYQGKLTDAGNPANGNYDMQFKLFDTQGAGTGTQQGGTITNPTVSVTAGSFSVLLDFGSTVFTGATRYLEIGVRPAGNVNPYTVLSPRQLITSSPYAIQTIKATIADSLSGGCVGCVQDAQINSIAGSKVNGLIPVSSLPPGNSNYIQNTTIQQASANFNIAGNGILGALNANGAFSLGGIAAPPTAPASQGRIYFDSATNKLKVSESGGAFINLVGAGGISGTGTTNTIPLWSANTAIGDSVITQSASNIGIGTTSPPHRLSAFGGPGWTSDFWSGSIGVQNSAAIGWQANASGIRFGMGHSTNGFNIFHTAADLGTTASGPSYVFRIDNSGNVGIGNLGFGTTLTSKLEIFAQDGLAISGVQPFLTLRDTSSGNTRGILASGAGDISIYPNTFIGGIAAVTVKNSTGNVGIGTATPGNKLHVTTGSGNAIYGTTGGASAIGVFGESTVFEGVRGVSHSTTAGGVVGYNLSTGVGVYAQSDNGIGMQARSIIGAGVDGGSASGIGVYGVSTTGFAMFANGNAGQARDRNGFVKAMILVNDNGAILRCYNGITNSSLGNCGFTVSNDSAQVGDWKIDFGFEVDDRFISVTPKGYPVTVNVQNIGANVKPCVFTPTGPNILCVTTFYTDVRNNYTAAPFFVFVY